MVDRDPKQPKSLKLNVSKEWCERMANAEVDRDPIEQLKGKVAKWRDLVHFSEAGSVTELLDELEALLGSARLQKEDVEHLVRWLERERAGVDHHHYCSWRQVVEKTLDNLSALLQGSARLQKERKGEELNARGADSQYRDQQATARDTMGMGRKKLSDAERLEWIRAMCADQPAECRSLQAVSPLVGEATSEGSVSVNPEKEKTDTQIGKPV